jgi:hypothetical protein
VFVAAAVEPLIPSLTDGGLYAIESRLIAAGLLLAFAFPNLGSKWFCHTEQMFGRLARRQGVSVLVVGLLCLILRCALLPWFPIPVPGVADEYSYLLQGDTFAHARLTNPTPPMWTHFDTFEVVFHPTYASKYPPMQGLVLAAGQVFSGHPWLGVLVSVAAMCAAVCWMLQGWLPPGWALLGGILAVLRLGTFSYWANSYWGGATAAIGGALVLGSMPRIMRKHRLGHAWLMGLGLAILANSRPYEGLLLSLPVAAILVAWMLGKTSTPKRVLVRCVVLPLVVCMVLIAGTIAYYNWQVTGNPVVLPYRVHFSQYELVPLFVWQGLNPQTPTYTDRFIRAFYTSVELPLYQHLHAHPILWFPRAALSKLLILDSFYLGPVLTLPFLALPLVARDRRIRPLLWIGFIVLSGLMSEVWFLPHYAAPATALLYVLLLQSLRHLRVWAVRSKPVGSMIVRATSIVCVLMVVIRLNAGPSSMWAWYANWPGNLERAQIAEKLQKSPERQLVIVRYGPNHSAQTEWVHNGADIEGEKVIWARDQTESGNRELIQHFRDRQVWLLEPDQNPPRLSLYLASVEASRHPGNP